MTVHVDGDAIPSPYESFDFEFREPDQDYKTVRLDDGNDVKYFFGTSKKSLGSSDLRGFSILVRGKVAQAPVPPEEGCRCFGNPFREGVHHP